MMSTTIGKKASVKWNIPDVKDSKSPRTPRSVRSHGESISEKYVYSDTFEDHSQSHLPSEALDSYSYSDTFINDTSAAVNSKHRVGFKAFHRDHSAESDNIHTMISATDRGETSEIYEATNLETAISATDVLQTVLEVDTDVSEFTPLDTDMPDTAHDISESHLAESYSYTDTFESGGRAKGDSQYDASSLVDSYTSTFTGTLTRPSRMWLEKSGEDSLDRSFVAPDYDGKSFVDDDSDDTMNDDYSYTFEPTEISSQVHLVDPEEVQREAEMEMLAEVAENDFVYAMTRKLKGKQKKTFLQKLPPDSDDESEDDYQKHFCKKKVKMMKRRKLSQQEDSAPAIPPHPLVAERQQNGDVPPELLERVKLNRIMSAMKKAAEQKVHDPRKCSDCSKLKLNLDTEAAERAFVSSRAKTLKSKMMDARVEEHLLKMNSISMIAELASELPRLTEKPEKIMDRLFEPLLGKNVIR